MPLRNGIPLTYTGITVSDTQDSTNIGRGAQRALTNLIPNPNTRGTWVCRPGQVPYDFSPVLPDPGFISGMLVDGNTLYGLIASGGFDTPFAYDLSAGAFLTVNGITVDNVPVAAPASGEWTPPILARVGSRIIVTHTGFPGTSIVPDPTYGIKFGWFDISEFSRQVSADYYTNVPFLYGGPDLVFGVQPGLAVTGSSDFPADLTVINVYPNTQSVWTFFGDSHGSDIIDGIAVGDMVEMFPGKTVAGPGVQAGTVIVNIPTGTSIQLSQPTTTSETAGIFKVYGNITNQVGYLNHGDFLAGSQNVTNATMIDLHIGHTLAGPSIPPGAVVTSIDRPGNNFVMSQPATQTVTFVANPAAASFSSAGSVIELSDVPSGTSEPFTAILLEGGTPTAPLWGAGDTAISHLPGVPVGVGQMNGRAWFAQGLDGIPFSDALLPCIRTNATQALVPGSGIAVTAIGVLMLQAPITGGIVQSLIAFQGGQAMQQITGDPVTANLKMDAMNVATGTLSPLSVVNSALGLFFVSPQGLRLIDFAGKVSDPIGQDGAGIIEVFLDLVAPPQTGTAYASRVCAAVNGRTLRIDVPLVDGTVANYWYDITRRLWTGPHTGSASLCSGWSDTFIVTPSGIDSAISRADDSQQPYSVYTENGQAIQWRWESALLPDNERMEVNTIIESLIGTALPIGTTVRIGFYNENTQLLDSVLIIGTISADYRQRAVAWHEPLVFKQGFVRVNGAGIANLMVGNFYMRYQILGYPSNLSIDEEGTVPEGDDFLLDNTGDVILDSNLGDTVHLTPDVTG